MGFYRQDDVPRECSICGKMIMKHLWMMDLFRDHPGRLVLWIHEQCARRAIETFFIKREEKKERERG